MWGNLKITFSYCPIDISDEELIEGLNSHIDHYVKTRGDSQESKYADVNLWRRLESFTVSDASKDGDGVYLIPETDMVLFCPFSEQTGGTTTKESNVAYFHGDIARPRTIISILHELGHRWDFKNLREQSIGSSMQDHPHSEIAEILRAERSATAFAIKCLKTLKSDNQTWSDIRTFLIDFALSREYKNFNSRIEDVTSDHGQKLSRMLIGYDDGNWEDEFFEAFDITKRYRRPTDEKKSDIEK